jgi:signal transduction histidine kinase
MALGLALLLANVAIAAALMFISPHDMRLLLVLGGYALVAAAVPALLAGRSLGRRLGHLEQAAARIAAGDLGTSVVVDGRDDIARLADAFNTMSTALREANERRGALEASRRELFAAISHDLRTPLSSIRAMVEALSDGVVTDEATTTRYLATMNADITQLSTLIDDLFELARIDSGALQLRVESLSLDEIVIPAVEAIRPAADRARVRLHCRSPAPTVVNVDPQGLSRVLTNLLQNAIRHTPADGSVVVSASIEGPEIVVAVRDTGEGIAPGDLPKVFERFYRGEKSRSRALGGSGLGLSISRGIIEAHGGRIWIDATGAAGTTIKFSLPADGPVQPA